MQPCRGSRLEGGRGAGWCERLQRTGLQQGWGHARSRLRGVRGRLSGRASSREVAVPHTLAVTSSLARRPRPGAVY